MAQYLRKSNIWKNAIRGQKLCPKSFCIANKEMKQLDIDASSNDSEKSLSDGSMLSTDSRSSDKHDKVIGVEQSRKKTNKILLAAGKSPMKLHSLFKRQRLAYGQEKVTSTVEKLNEEICSTLDLPSQESRTK